jgi:hypothetical protein
VKRPAHPVCHTFQGMHSNSITFYYLYEVNIIQNNYRGAGKSLAQPGRKQATATEDFDVHISYLLS